MTRPLTGSVFSSKIEADSPVELGDAWFLPGSLAGLFGAPASPLEFFVPLERVFQSGLKVLAGAAVPREAPPVGLAAAPSGAGSREHDAMHRHAAIPSKLG